MGELRGKNIRGERGRRRRRREEERRTAVAVAEVVEERRDGRRGMEGLAMLRQLIGEVQELCELYGSSNYIPHQPHTQLLYHHHQHSHRSLSLSNAR